MNIYFTGIDGRTVPVPLRSEDGCEIALRWCETGNTVFVDHTVGVGTYRVFPGPPDTAAPERETTRAPLERDRYREILEDLLDGFIASEDEGELLLRALQVFRSIVRPLRLSRATESEVVEQMRDALELTQAALSDTMQRLTNYDWNVDPDSMTLHQGRAMEAAAAALRWTPETDA